MKQTILLVDDDELFTDLLQMCLPSVTHQWTILTAPNGLAAMELLEKSKVDLLVTDTSMPLMNGLELVAEVQISHPQLPIIVMTSGGSGLSAVRADSQLTVLQKPLSVERLQTEIARVLAPAERANMQSIPLTSFLQLLHQERKQVTVRVDRPGAFGLLHVLDGQLFDAEAGPLIGLAAAYEILRWTDARMKMLPLTPNRPITIQDKIEFVIMEAARLSDEAKLRGQPQTDESNFSEVSFGSSILMPVGGEARAYHQQPVPEAATHVPPRPPVVVPQSAAVAPRGAPLKFASVVQALSQPQIRGAHAVARPTGEVAYSNQCGKAEIERAQYLVHLASLAGRELGLQRVFEARVIGKNHAIWVREGARMSVVAEVSASMDFDQLAHTISGDIE